MAETKGEWRAAAAAWDRTGARTEDDLCSAAACAHMSGETELYGRLLERARERYPRHPRLVFEEVRELPPDEQVTGLADVELREQTDVALISAQRSLAYLMLQDIDEAERQAAKTAEAMPESTLAESVAVNVVVQRARFNQLEDRSQNAAALRDANRRALKLRDQLLRQRRWEESGRTLMLAADTLTLQGELMDAAELLMQATPEELATRDGADVLGHAALRALAPRDALRLTENAEWTPAVRHIRATAVLEKTGSSASERTRAVQELDQLVAADDRQVALEAAIARLADTMLGHTEWSEGAEALLMDTGHKRPALLMRAFYLGQRRGDWEGAYALFAEHADQPWVPAARLMVALAWGRHSVMKQAADDVMASGPSQMVRLSCGRAYRIVGEVARAREVFE
jgi:tetratricopeptide (TPR) repeat protein